MTEDVYRHSAYLPMSAEALADAGETAAAFNRWMTASPGERIQWAREAEARRREEIRAGVPVPLTLDALLGKLGFSPEYAEHLVQPYCYCGDGPDGWDVCSYARDLGLGPS